MSNVTETFQRELKNISCTPDEKKRITSLFNQIISEHLSNVKQYEDLIGDRNDKIISLTDELATANAVVEESISHNEAWSESND